MANEGTINVVDVGGTQYGIGSGYIIQKDDGQAIPIRPYLQIKNANVYDDVDNEKSVVEMATEINDRVASEKSTYSSKKIEDKLEETIKPFNESAEAVSGSGRANSNVKIYDLGTSYTTAMSDDIKAGKFDAVRTGGHITLNGRKYWMGHADYLLHTGSTSLETHHMLVFPDKNFYNHVMEDSNITTNGYYNSKMKRSGLDQALNTIKADFGEDHILTYRNYYNNAAKDGIPTGGGEFTSQIDLMSERMVYGTGFFQPTSNGNTVPWIYSYCKSQLALFQACPELISNRQHYWLMDVVSSQTFAYVYHNGYATRSNASYTGIGVRPFFLIY